MGTLVGCGVGVVGDCVGRDVVGDLVGADVVGAPVVGAALVGERVVRVLVGTLVGERVGKADGLKVVGATVSSSSATLIRKSSSSSSSRKYVTYWFTVRSWRRLFVLGFFPITTGTSSVDGERVALGST